MILALLVGGMAAASTVYLVRQWWRWRRESDPLRPLDNGRRPR